ncbi:hypothetical protein L1887_27965 [Cichorium endivia]|nr:hypothetical protein L1887_27965 [Cichorium endivia]
MNEIVRELATALIYQTSPLPPPLPVAAPMSEWNTDFPSLSNNSNMSPPPLPSPSTGNTPPPPPPILVAPPLPRRSTEFPSISNNRTASPPPSPPRLLPEWSTERSTEFPESSNVPSQPQLPRAKNNKVVMRF